MTARRWLWRCLVPAGPVVLAVLLLPGTAPAAPASALPGTLRLQLVPPMAGVTAKVDGDTARSDRLGRMKLRVRNFTGLDDRLSVLPTTVAEGRRVVFDRTRGSVDHGVRGRIVEVGLRTIRQVHWNFLNRFDEAVPIDRVSTMRLRSNTGEIFNLAGRQLREPLWVAESRTQQGPRGLASKRLYYVVDDVVVDGASVVNRAGQKFVPWDLQSWTVRLLFYRVSFTATDMFFGWSAGDGIALTRADGRVERLRFAADRTAVVPDLPRGTYTVTVAGGGVSFARPVSISRDQQVVLTVITPFDLGLVVAGLLTLAIGVVLIGRPHLRRRLRWRRGSGTGPPWRPRQRRERPPARPDRHAVTTGAAAAAAVLLAGLLCPVPARPAWAAVPARPAMAAVPARSGSAGASTVRPTPVLAHYYIWFNATSWNRAKVDYPALGRYSSDDTEIMRRHVRMAKAAGIDGFLVSWKRTPLLDDRLAKLVEVAAAEDFRLGIVYQGIDFSRNPLPLATVRADLRYFTQRYAAEPVFDIFDRPVVIWNGSERFDPDEIAETTREARRDLLVLGTAKNVEAVESSRSALDGQAYYWSSADPESDRVADRLDAMARAVRQGGGLWIAPVTPGFDARLIGGRRQVGRRDGETLRASFAAARHSAPDAIGVISWNEFSENTHIEPSERFGATYLRVLADLLEVSLDPDVSPESSQADGEYRALPPWVALLAGAGVLALGPAGLLIRRRRTRVAATATAASGPTAASADGGPATDAHGSTGSRGKDV
ncbi:endo-1,3-alpha-glucanase family glycosylhydrolase [Micromonospora yangpuensis]|uniref:Glycosyl hydrolase family 71 n=1 Tax=Micromonospora yangpuensis TaxID=683228 RepID=A0A1C6U7T9_9ACTN|nr:endo-1,3-alpha-glucanase family glycosylhydrolase [Micromonospora yangpuensis]GGL89758.1 hypothetical protein GCM10012279_04270 [Micromonospora yangpuensis]SCL50126.1 Glycosyl hydrolase family 71 [Micromonospora yangpuensis]